MQIIWPFVSAHWLALAIAIGLICALYASIQVEAMRKRGPNDATGNGIVVGKAKAFDNRSLQLRIERLSASLSALKTINQNVTDGLARMQGGVSSSTHHSLSVGFNSSERDTRPESRQKKPTPDSKIEPLPKVKDHAAEDEEKITVGLAASDLLAGQLNLASQIMNLELLYERSLTDRLFEDGIRAQTVLGFQVSINPKAGDEDCIAIVEIGVSLGASGTPISLIALIPQERTYNTIAATTNTTELDGSAKAYRTRFGLGRKRGSKWTYVDRDADTIAFQRDGDSVPPLFPNNFPVLVFGWEFRPVLGQRCVAAGVRQLLAVVAIPRRDVPGPDEFALDIRTRTYWRRYNRKTLASSARWHYWPRRIDGSNVIIGVEQRLSIPNNPKTQSILAPTIDHIRWVHSGADQATVIVTGTNFFSGTTILVGGVTFSEERGSLILKSEQSMEFTTSIASLSTGDAVVNGRFGPSFRLEMRHGHSAMQGFYILRASIKPSRYTKKLRITVAVKCIDINGVDQDLTTKDFDNIPEPILLVGDEVVPPPYDYDNITPDLNQTYSGNLAGGTKYIQVSAWISPKALTNPTVTFVAPFCGSDFVVSLPISLAEPSISRLGGDEVKSIFRIYYPFGTDLSISVVLDREYSEASAELKKLSPVDYRLEVDTSIANKYQNIIFRIGTADPYLIPMPPNPAPTLRPIISTGARPPRVRRMERGPVEWSGSDLDGMAGVTFYAPGIEIPSANSLNNDTQHAGLVAEFAVYDFNKKIEVLLPEGGTTITGKAVVVFTTISGSVIKMPIYILSED